MNAKELHPLPQFVKVLRQAVRDGVKTRTRRVAKPQPPRQEPQLRLFDDAPWPPQRDGRGAPCGAPGVYYLREPLARVRHPDWPKRKGYVASYADDGELCKDGGKLVKWRWKRKVIPQLFMPKSLARTLVRVTLRRGEWLQELTLEEAVAEGLASDLFPVGGDYVRKYGLVGWQHGQFRQSPVDAFESLWDSINDRPKAKERHPWKSNPFVWVVGFELV